jgi:DNA repair protein RecN (Recombination protein N)
MLRELRIKDFTIIDDLTVSFEPGFNVLTGETGAGKSIIVDALGLLLGERASQDLIRSGRTEARIEAFFDGADIPVLAELGIDAGDGIILRRTIAGQGKGRAFVNDSPVALATLAAAGRALVDIHGQHEQQGLLKSEAHIGFVDLLGGLGEDVAAVSAAYQEAAGLREQLKQLSERLRERTHRIDLLRFQQTEIDNANLAQGEKTALEEERGVLANLSKLREASEAAYAMLYGDEGSVVERLGKAATLSSDIARIDKNAEEARALLASALPLVEDASSSLRGLRDRYDADPRRLDEVEERLELIRRLEKKYGEGIEGVLLYRDTAARELAGLEHADEQRDAREKALAAQETRLRALAEALSGKRKRVAATLEKSIVGELRELGFQKVRFVVEQRLLQEAGPSGIDAVEFLFSANPGEPPRPLVKIASGGELSRIMLGLECLEIEKAAPRGTDLVRTLIFDEVDAGIGGMTAKQVGARLHSLAAAYQVLCITHLPQIAAQANHHLKVDKAISAKEVKVTVASLGARDRREELARMLAGSVTDRSLSHAEELLGIDKKG